MRFDRILTCVAPFLYFDHGIVCDHGNREIFLPTDTAQIRLSPGKRFQDLHRFRWGNRVHATVHRGVLWRSARVGGRVEHNDPVRDDRRRAGFGLSARVEFHR